MKESQNNNSVDISYIIRGSYQWRGTTRSAITLSGKFLGKLWKVDISGNFEIF